MPKRNSQRKDKPIVASAAAAIGGMRLELAIAPGERQTPVEIFRRALAARRWRYTRERAEILREALATLYRHFDADDLEDDGDDELAALIDELEPPTDSAEAVEDLVRCTLLLADETRPRAPRRR